MAKTSVRARLLFYSLLSVAMLVAISVYALVQMAALDRLTGSLDRKWVRGTHILGEMADLLSEVRLDEIGLGLAAERAPDAALPPADEHYDELIARRAEYEALEKGPEEVRLLRDFDAKWSVWAEEHRAWTGLPVDRLAAAGPVYQVRANAFYRTTDDAIDALIEENAAGARRAGQLADQILGGASGFLALAVLAAILLSGWVLWVINVRISGPLAEMTKALSALAAGDRGAVMPQTDRHDEIGRMAQAFEVFRANAVALEDAQALAERLARYDALTGLANRRVLADELEKALGRVDRGMEPFAVLVIDLDRFKPVNDVHGHGAGDLVLSEITARLRAVVRKHDTRARIGGDEFAIVMALDRDRTDRTREPIRLAERIVAAVAAPVPIGARAVVVGASIGIALCPGDGADADALLRAADIAMYRAKESGRGTFRFYEASMDAELRSRAELEADVQRGLGQGEIQPYYQPLIQLSDGRLLGFEILARWHHPENGLILPDVFIPVIDHLGLMEDFTLNMLRRACRDAQSWPAALRLSLNVSPRELTDRLFPMRVLAVLAETGFSPARLEIEITEDALISDLATAKEVLAMLQSAGITVALDDFGTGYSSLFHLRELKLDKIKIDRRFIQSMKENPESAKIVFGILGLARNLALPTTAEGIEDFEILRRLDDAGCEIGQGFYFTHAMPADDAGDWARHPTNHPARRLTPV